MADISRYKGGARVGAKPRPRGGPRTRYQVAAPRYEDTVVAERRETAQAGNNRARYTPEQNANDRDVFDLRTGSFTEELPVTAPPEGRRPRIPRPRASIGGNEVEVDGDQVRVTRRFKRGGVVRKEPDIKVPTGEQVTFDQNGTKRRVRGSQVPPK
jgi:hypothetical protein